jgi:ankyrin repeat protein
LSLSCRQAGSGGSISIQEAAGQGDLATLQSLLSSGTAVDSRDESGCTALHFAADRGQQEAVNALLAAGADVNAVDEDQQTPLHYAAMCGHEEVSPAGGFGVMLRVVLNLSERCAPCRDLG